MNRKTAVFLIAAACVAASCGRAGKGKTIEIALVTKALDSEWWQRVKSGAEEAARAAPGVRLAVLAPEREVNIDQQVGILEDQITRGISALAVAPAGVSEILPVLDKAKAAGIPVLIVDTDVNWPAKLSYIGANNRLGGQIAGEYIVKMLGGKGKVAVIRGILGIATHEERLAGFREAIARAPGIECVAVQPANSERALGMTVMENLLTAHPDLKAVFATNDQMALGAVEAIAAHNLTGRVEVVGFDATREAVRAVVAGRLSGDMAGLPEVMGRRSVEEAIKAAKGEPVDKQVVITPVLVTKENASQFLR
ncbi:MAG: sugar ABC transporter substrate-binding protein [Bryobacteraceae bacterium]|jgi:ribose transport system substrate-binding protein